MAYTITELMSNVHPLPDQPGRYFAGYYVEIRGHKKYSGMSETAYGDSDIEALDKAKEACLQKVKDLCGPNE